MPRKRIDAKRVVTPGDFITIIIIASGMLLAVFADEAAFKLIGVSIAILGIVRLVMFITNRVNIMIENNKLRPNTPSQEFKTTESQDKKAKHVIIEDFTPPVSEKIHEGEIEKFTKEIRDEEGFRVLKEKDDDAIIGLETVEQSLKNNQNDENYSEPEKQISFKPEEIPDDFEFEEELSAVKIVAKEVKISDKVVVKGDEPSDELFPPAKEFDSEVILKSEIVHDTEFFKGKKLNIPISELMETEPAFGDEPRKEFEYFLNRTLKVIRSVTTTKSAVFVLVNSERREIIVEAFDSDIPGQIAVRRRIPFGNDIVSQIINNLKPEILTEINPHAELDLIPYYLQSVGTSSFFGMPVFYNEAIVGILCADSDETYAYDTSVVSLFGHFAKLIGGLVKSYTGKYDLLQDSRTLKGLNQMREMLSDKELSLDKLYEAVLDSASSIFDYAITGVIGFNRETNDWRIVRVVNRNYPDDLEINTRLSPGSLSAASIEGSETLINAQNISGQVRINDNEKKLDSGYFIASPLKSFTNNYGVLFVEGMNSADITSYDIEMLETLAAHAGTTLEQIHFSEILTRNALFDPTTGLLNTPAFLQRLNEEVMRSLDFGYPMTLCLIEIDEYKSFDPASHAERHEKILLHVIDIMQSKLRTYDLLGRAESKIFGVVLIDVNTRSAKSWAEKLRSEVAISVLKIANDSFTVTVSIGVAELRKNESIEDVFRNAKEMLNLSRQKTNTVTVYE